MEKKLENMTKKELIEKINDLETQCGDKDTAYASLHDQYTKLGIRAAQDIDDLTKKNEDLIEELKIEELKHKVYVTATASWDDMSFYKEANAELRKKNEAIHKEAKRWKKEATEAKAELDVMWAKYHTLKFHFDKLKDEDRKWTSANPAVQAALERKINVLEKEINKYKAEASEWEAKYEYQEGQTDCVIKDFNELNKKYEQLLKRFDSLCIDHAKVSRDYNKMVDQTTKAAALEERNKDLIRQCDELYDKNKELDAENAYLTDEVDNLKKILKYTENYKDRLKKTVNKMYGISSEIPDIIDPSDFDDRARKCAIIFSKTIDDMIRAYNMDVNSYRDGSIAGVAKAVNTIHGGHIWLDNLEKAMRNLSEEVEKYIKRVGEKND